MKTLSLIIPCYGEEETIRPFLEETRKVERELSSELLFDYIFVNDGSKDNTLSVLREVSQKYIFGSNSGGSCKSASITVI